MGIVDEALQTPESVKQKWYCSECRVRRAAYSNGLCHFCSNINVPERLQRLEQLIARAEYELPLFPHRVRIRSDEYRMESQVKVAISVIENPDHVVLLDFGNGRKVELQPEEAQALLSNQNIRDAIRSTVAKCHYERQKVAEDMHSVIDIPKAVKKKVINLKTESVPGQES